MIDPQRTPADGPPSPRRQRTLRGPATVSGIGLFTGADVTLRFCPAPPNHGIAFQRTDSPGTAPVPALIEYTVPRRRRTAIAHHGVTVEMTEHVLAALAGLRIDNCLVQLDAPEPPAGDGSAAAFVDALLEAGCLEQQAPRRTLVVEQTLCITAEDDRAEITVEPTDDPRLTIAYHLDYGPASPIPPQTRTVAVTPETFVGDLALARTFVLQSEVDALKARGYGRRTTARDLLVFGPDGPVDNRLRADDECARHKILDCLGDLALIGCGLHARITAVRSGHGLNRALVRKLKETHAQQFPAPDQAAA